MTTTAGDPPFFELRNITKAYPGVLAVDDVTLSIEAGSIVGLVGKNGAGKSTVIKVMAGAIRQDAGQLLLDGEHLDLHHPHQATEARLAFVHQDLYDVADLSVAENVMLGLGFPKKWGAFVDWSELYRRASDEIRRLEVEIDPRVAIGELSVAEQRLVMIARGLAQDARLLVLDEPTASLTDDEIEHLFRAIRRLRDDGITVVYVSHRLEEIFEITDRVVVMRNGSVVADEPTSAIDRRQLISHITGHERAETAIERRRSHNIGGRPDAPVLLEVVDITADTGVHGCTFDLREGEILGIAGLVGTGRTELVRAIFGADRLTGGTIKVRGEEVDIRSPEQAMKAGLALMPEDRKTQGNVMDFSVRQNVTLASLDKHRIRPRLAAPSAASEKAETARMIERLAIATPDDRQLVRLLSGGNQQKVVIGKWLSQGSDILIFDEPTHGVDVDGKDEIYDIMQELADQGKGVIFISSEFSEMVGVCQRILAIRDGRIMGELEGDEINEEAVVELCYTDDGLRATAGTA
jgi:ABC-type sugar transport system ATPase subunit